MEDLLAEARKQPRKGEIPDSQRQALRKLIDRLTHVEPLADQQRARRKSGK